MTKSWIILLIAVSPCLSAQTADWEVSINNFIKSQEIIRAAEDPAENRAEYKEARKIIRGRINVGATGEWRDVLAVYYTLEEYNTYHGYLTLYDIKSKTFVPPLIVGGKGFRSVELKSVNGSVCFETNSYAVDDSEANPSIQGKSCFELDEKGFLFEARERLYEKPDQSR